MHSPLPKRIRLEILGTQNAFRAVCPLGSKTSGHSWRWRPNALPLSTPLQLSRTEYLVLRQVDPERRAAYGVSTGYRVAAIPPTAAGPNPDVAIVGLYCHNLQIRRHPNDHEIRPDQFAGSDVWSATVRIRSCRFKIVRWRGSHFGSREPAHIERSRSPVAAKVFPTDAEHHWGTP